jgi:hypothetical protein
MNLKTMPLSDMLDRYNQAMDKHNSLEDGKEKEAIAFVLKQMDSIIDKILDEIVAQVFKVTPHLGDDEELA